MSKEKKSSGAFSPADKLPSNVPDAVDPDIKVKKVSSEPMKGAKVGGSKAGPASYQFTGVAPGSKQREVVVNSQ